MNGCLHAVIDQRRATVVCFRIDLDQLVGVREIHVDLAIAGQRAILGLPPRGMFVIVVPAAGSHSQLGPAPEVPVSGRWSTS